ncbi:MAG: dockerin type I domain-containing protein [Patescibacteria group bacterium]|jgi:hypothetical protein
MPRPKIIPNPKKVLTKTKVYTHTSVKLSILLMIAAATVGTGIISAGLILAALPTKVKQSAPILAAPVSINKSQDNVVLIKFKPNLNQTKRLKAVTTALKKPVKCLIRTSSVASKWPKKSIKTVNYYDACSLKIQSLMPVVSVSDNVNSGFSERAARSDAKLAAQAKADLSRWYVLTVKGTPDLNSLVKIFSGVEGIEVAAKNPQLSAAGVITNSAAATAYSLINAQAAQDNVYGVEGDANGDGQATWLDIVYLKDYLFGSGPAPKHIYLVDFNKNGIVDVGDLIILARNLDTTNPTPKDLNKDGLVNYDDVNYLINYIFNGGPAPSPLSNADLNADGSVNIGDAVMFVRYLQENSIQLSCLTGDANGDGSVNVLDAYYISDYIFKNGPAPSPLLCGDVNGDGKVTIGDAVALVHLQRNSSLTNSPEVKAAVFVNPLSPSTNVIQNNTVPEFLVGDVNGDAKINSDDVTYLLDYIFSNGPAPSPLARADVNNDGKVNVGDAIALVQQVAEAVAAKAAVADLNNDGKVNNADAQFIVDYIFNNGPAPDLNKADINNDGKVNIGDAIALSLYLTETQTQLTQDSFQMPEGDQNYIIGDVNGDNQVNLDDANFLVNYLFKDGPAPSPLARGDVNQDGQVNIGDAITIARIVEQNNNDNSLTLVGDVSGDQKVDYQDVDALSKALVKGYASPAGDINQDGRSGDLLDLYAMVEILKLEANNQNSYDFNGDGKVNLSDVDYLIAYILKNGPAPADLDAADVNGDGLVNIGDCIALVRMLTNVNALDFIRGDVDKDGLVTQSDIDFLIAYLFKNGPAPEPIGRGDVNADGLVNIGDAIALVLKLYPRETDSSPDILVKVAVLDTGYNNTVGKVSASALMNYNVKNYYGWNALTGGSTKDLNGHGTNVVKLIQYIAPKAKILPVSILNSQGIGTCLSATQGLGYAVKQGVDIINISASGLGNCELFNTAVKWAEGNGALVVVAAGNDSSVVKGWQSRSEALIVGATNKGIRTKYTNAANIYAPELPDNKGTSLSAALVSGSLGLYLAKPTNLTVDQIQIQTLKTATKLKGLPIINAGELTK